MAGDLDGHYRGVLVASDLKMHTAVAARPVEANLAAIARVGC